MCDLSKSKSHTTTAGLAAYAQEIMHKDKNACVLFVVGYTKRNRRYFAARSVYRQYSNEFIIKVDKQNTSLTIDALAHVLPKVGCKDCKLYVVSGNDSCIKEDCKDTSNKVSWRQVYEYLVENNVKIVEFNTKEPGEIHSIIKDSSVFKAEQKLRKNKYETEKKTETQTKPKIAKNSDYDRALDELEKELLAIDWKEDKRKTVFSDTKKKKAASTKAKDDSEVTDKPKQKKSGPATKEEKAQTKKERAPKEKKLPKIESEKPKQNKGMSFVTNTIQVEDFNVKKFISKRKGEFCLFTTGSKHDNFGDKHSNGTFEYVVAYEDKSVHDSGEVLASLSANDVMLRGIFQAIDKRVPNGAKLNIMIFTNMGFGRPSKSTNRQYFAQIDKVLKQKNIDAVVHYVNGGKDKIRTFVESFRK